MIVEVVAFLGDAWDPITAAGALAGRPQYRTMSLDGHLTSVQAEVDALFVRATVALLRASNSQLWSLLAMVPFQCVSADGAWRILTCASWRAHAWVWTTADPNHRLFSPLPLAPPGPLPHHAPSLAPCPAPTRFSRPRPRP